VVLVGGAKAAQLLVALSDLCGEESCFGGGDDLAGGLAPYGGVEMQGSGGDGELLTSMVKSYVIGLGSSLDGRSLEASCVLESSSEDPANSLQTHNK
jgi:hypothetical protein